MTVAQIRVVNKMKENHECLLSHTAKGDVYVESINKSKGESLYYVVKRNGKASLIEVKKFMRRK